MATLKEDHDSWAAGGIIRRDFRHTHAGPEELPHKGKRGKAKRGKRYKGCPERDGGAHVYVWIEYFGKEWGWASDGRRNLVQKKKDVHWFEKVCIGCGHKNDCIYDWGWEWLSRKQKARTQPEVYEVRHVEYGYQW